MPRPTTGRNGRLQPPVANNPGAIFQPPSTGPVGAADGLSLGGEWTETAHPGQRHREKQRPEAKVRAGEDTPTSGSCRTARSTLPFDFPPQRTPEFRPGQGALSKETKLQLGVPVIQIRVMIGSGRHQL